MRAAGCAAMLFGASCGREGSGAGSVGRPMTVAPEDASVARALRLSVETLASGFGARPGSDPARLERVSSWILERLQAAGCTARREPFRVGGVLYWNVTAEVRGSGAPAAGLLVGAHYDTEPGTPGADDNASGVAVLLELAARIASRPAPSRVRFAAYALEEMPYFATGTMGSAAHVRELERAGDLPSGMVSLEMLGYFSDEPGSQTFPYPIFSWIYPRQGSFVAFVSDLGSRSFNRRTHRLFRQAVDLPAERLSAPALVPGVDFSDHRSFSAAGVPALMVTDTAFYRNPHYHAATDVPGTLDYERMAKVVRGLEAVLRSL